MKKQFYEMFCDIWEYFQGFSLWKEFFYGIVMCVKYGEKV